MKILTTKRWVLEKTSKIGKCSVRITERAYADDENDSADINNVKEILKNHKSNMNGCRQS